MRNTSGLFALLTLCAAVAFAQRELPPDLDSGPLTFRTAPPKSDKPEAPKPDTHGVYPITPDTVVPVLLHSLPAVASLEDMPECTPPVVTLSAVIGVDGHAVIRNVFTPRSSPCANLAIMAVKNSLFRPASYYGRPIPVMACFNVQFLSDQPSIPHIQRCPVNAAAFQRLEANTSPPVLEDEEEARPRLEFHAQEQVTNRQTRDVRLAAPVPDEHGAYSPGGGSGSASIGEQASLSAGPDAELPDDVQPPIPIDVPMAEYSVEARRKKIQGVVLVSIVVDEKGLPNSPHVEKGLGYGLDVNAVDAAMKSRFHPARRDGIAVPVRITVEVKFNIVK